MEWKLVSFFLPPLEQLLQDIYRHLSELFYGMYGLDEQPSKLELVLSNVA